MRPAFSNSDSFDQTLQSSQKPLIGPIDLRYDSMFGVASGATLAGERRTIYRVNSTGEAEMDREGPHRPEPNDTPGGMPQPSQPETIEQKLARIRAEIDAGVYETPEKLEIAISRMLGVIGD